MKQELDDKLCADFPKLFRERYYPMDKTCMCWGFEVSDGWEPLIRECAAKLEAINDKIENPDHYVVAMQVKSKFGGLRFYTGSYPMEYSEEVEAAIRQAENKSEKTCESCGKPGKPRGNGWIRTSCEEHERTK
jgi:hypothetical protein